MFRRLLAAIFGRQVASQVHPGAAQQAAAWQAQQGSQQAAWQAQQAAQQAAQQTFVPPPPPPTFPH